uniref:MFS transporter n=1 Tax=uncultured Sphingomonas sp. TaxID=158754 RepID=UPI0035CB49DD
MDLRPAWLRDLSRYQITVFLVVALAWGFDSLDQRIFSLARIPALASLMGRHGSDISVQTTAKIATAAFLLGWGFGGIIIGAAGDRLGRSRMLAFSIIGYSVCTGLTALSPSATIFTILRFLTGLGIGGVFGLAVATLAETVAGSARIAMLAWLQIISLFCNVAAGFIKMGLDGLAVHGWIAPSETWRWLFAIGALPAVVGIFAGLKIEESQSWRKMKAENKLPTSIAAAYGLLFRDRTERRGLVVGTALSIAGVVGLWSVGEFAVDLQESVFTSYYSRASAAADVIGLVAAAKNWAFVLQMLGGACGMLLFAAAANRFGRRVAFMTGFAAACVITLFVYRYLDSPFDAYWMMPLMGAAQLSVFAGFSIYLPELFGTRVRGTGISFAYNSGRFAAAAGSFGSAYLTTWVYGALPAPLPLRYSAMTMCGIFVLGFVAAVFAPETRGRDLRD